MKINCLRGLHGVTGVMAMLLLSGCGSSAENEVYLAFKCGKVATLMEQERLGDIALANAEPYFKELEAAGENPARLAMKMNERFQDEVPLYRMSVGGQMAALSDVFQSDECQALYKPRATAFAEPTGEPKNVTGEGEVNLAGCSVPSGISREAAERITCQSAPPADPTTKAPKPAVASVPDKALQEAFPTMLFACDTQNGKHIALTAMGDTVRYTFGRVGSEAEKTVDLPRASTSVKREEDPTSVTHRVDMPSWGTVYSVFWTASRDATRTEAAGVDVREGGELLASVACKPGTVQQELLSLPQSG